MAYKLTAGQKKTLKEIIQHICQRRLQAGTNLSEWALAQMSGTSRTPVRVALNYLVAEGLVAYERNYGYSLTADFNHIPSSIIEFLSQPDDPLYAQLAEARVAGQLAETVTEADLMRQFSATRASVRKVIMRAQREGWAEKTAGYGIHFLPIIDNYNAYDDMYRLRLAIEPAGILSPKFRPDLPQLQELQDEQQAILDGGHNLLTPYDRFESNVRFHETLMSWSHNQIALQTLRHLYQMRRLVEYRQEQQALPRQKLVTNDHLRILEAIKQGDTIIAASLLKQHISDAIEHKLAAVVFDHD